MAPDLPGVFVAGLLTFFSPCILPIIPYYLGMLAGTSVAAVRAGGGRARLLASGAAFSIGLGAVFIGLGLTATVAGRALVAHRQLVAQLAGVAVLLLGLKFLGVLRVPWLEQERRPLLARIRTGGLGGALLLGAAFGLGWTPCIGPVLGSVLAYVAARGANPVAGAMYLAAYSAGLVVPLLAIAAVAPAALRVLDRIKVHLHKVEIATGALLAAVGLLLITGGLAIAPAPSSSIAATPVADAPGPALPCADSTSSALTCGLGTAGSAGVSGISGAAGPTLLKFVSAQCPVCQRMAPVVAQAERSCSGRGVRVTGVDVGTAAGLAVARKHAVVGVPTFVFIGESGDEVARLVGEQPLSMLEQALQVLSGADCAGFSRIPSRGANASAPPAPSRS